MARRVMVLGLAYLLASVVAPNGHAQEMGPAQKAESFLSKVVAGDLNSGIEELIKGSFMMEKTQDVALLERQTSSIMPLYGSPLGFEKVSEQYYGASLVRMVYVLKLEKHALIWEFYFYRPAEDWFLAQVRWFDQFHLVPGGP